MSIMMDEGVSDPAVAGRQNVKFLLEVDGVGTLWLVRSVVINEAVGELFDGIIECVLDDAAPQATSLLGKRFELQVIRDAHRRLIGGMIRHVIATDIGESRVFALHVVPSTWRLGLGIGTRIYQDIRVPDLVSRVVHDGLGEIVEVDATGLSQTYESHEFLLQYQESAWNFISRCMEEEGIFFFFVHTDQGERLVLADAVHNLPHARHMVKGKVLYASSSSILPAFADEVVFDLEHADEVGATRVTMSGYDWTNPPLDVRTQQETPGPLSSAAEVYDHLDAVTYHRYDGQQYKYNSIKRNCEIRLQAIDLLRQRWSLCGNVVTAQPGYLLHVEECPHLSDGPVFMVVRGQSGGVVTEGATGTWANSLTVVPVTVPFRIDPRTSRPVVPGPETATVVGPSDEEIYTDVHGRIKVQFHWDRDGKRNERSSCWLRVAQMWSGPGWGTSFIPRVGMEVIVQFVGGDPNRPFVMGCLYNGSNRTPYALPDEKTKSTIKTNSTPGGGGSNELRFEDKKGSEQVYIHAERDFDEVMEHDHTTHVKNCQTNTVDVNQRETVGRNQTLHVKHDRKKTVDNDEVNVVQNNRTTTIKNDEKLTIEKGERVVSVETGADREEYLGGRYTKVEKVDDLVVAAGADKTVHVTGSYEVKVDGHYELTQATGNELKIDNFIHATSVGEIKLDSGDGAAFARVKPSGVIKLSADQEIELKVGGTTIKVSPGGVTIDCSTLRVNADALVQIQGALVKIN